MTIFSSAGGDRNEYAVFPDHCETVERFVSVGNDVVFVGNVFAGFRTVAYSTVDN